MAQDSPGDAQTKNPADALWSGKLQYDLATDSLEQHNLISVPAHQERIREMRGRLFNLLERTEGMQIPLRRGDWQAAERKAH